MMGSRLFNTLQHDLSHRVISGVRERDECGGSIGMLGGLVVQEEAWLAGWRALDFDVGPVDTGFRPEAGAEGLGGGFFGSKAGGVMHGGIRA